MRVVVKDKVIIDHDQRLSPSSLSIVSEVFKNLHDISTSDAKLNNEHTSPLYKKTLISPLNLPLSLR